VEGFYHFQIEEERIIDYNLMYDTLKLFSEIGHAIVAEGDETTISDYFTTLMELDLN
jgi:hypothetical protein